MPNSKEREDWRRDRNVRDRERKNRVFVHSTDRRHPKAHQLLTCDVYQHLSDIVDSPNRYRSSVQQIATTVIVEGAEVFFPDDETRRFHMNKVITSLKVNDDVVRDFFRNHNDVLRRTYERRRRV